MHASCPARRTFMLLGAGALVAAVGFFGPSSHAAMVATDNASNYNGSWSTTPPNNGSGFGPWDIVVSNNNSPPYVGTYLDNSSKAISTSSDSWGTYANGGSNNGRIDMMRAFTVDPTGYQDPSGLGTLHNQTLSVAMQTDGVGNGQSGPPNSAFGIILQQGQGSPAAALMTFEYIGTQASDTSVLTDNLGTDNTSVPVTFSDWNNGIVVNVTVGSITAGVNPYTLTVTNISGSTTYYTATGTTAGVMQQLDMFDSNTTGNGYFNQLAISPEAVPEPASLGFAFGEGLLMLARRRKNTLA